MTGANAKIKRIMIGDKQVRPVWTPGPNTLLYYKFEGNLNDSSGNNRTGTWYNGAGTYTTGIKGQGVNLGNSHAVKLPIACPSGDFTYSICVKFNSYNSYNSLLGVEQWASGGIHYHVSNVSTIKGINISFYGSGSGINIPGGIKELPSLDEWHNIIFTRSGNVWTIYLDGTQYAQGTQSYSVDQSYQWYVGKEYTDTRYIDGTIDEVIFENIAWSQSDITKYVSLLGL